MRDIRIVDLRADAVDTLAQIVRRDVGRHADGNAGAAIDEKIRKRCREHRGLLAGLVVVRNEIDGPLVHVGHERLRRGAASRASAYRMDAGGSPSTLAEVALPIDRAFRACAHGWRHVHERGVDRLVAVRMVVAHRLTDDLRALEVLAIRLHSELVHREKNAALRRLQPSRASGSAREMMTDMEKSRKDFDISSATFTFSTFSLVAIHASDDGKLGGRMGIQLARRRSSHSRGNGIRLADGVRRRNRGLARQV